MEYKQVFKFAGITISILLLSILTSCWKEVTSNSEAAKAETEKWELVVWMELQYPPFEMTDEKWNPTWISVDLANDMWKALWKKVRIENIAFSWLIPSLISKKIDIIISSMTITEERKKTISFSDSYAKSNLALLINKDSKVKNAEDLNMEWKKVAVKKWTTAYFYAEKSLPKSTILVFDNESACVLEVSQWKADAFIYDQLTIFRNWKKYKSTTRVNLNPVWDNTQEWWVAIRQEDTKLKEKINGFIADYKNSWGFNKLGIKYLAEEKKTFDELWIPFFF